MNTENKPVDYTKLIACIAEEEQKTIEETSQIPDTPVIRVVDYTAISDAWKEAKGKMGYKE